MRSLLLILIFAFTTLFAQERVKFDDKADPAKDLKKTIKIAQKENKQILMDVGGEWCIWCHRLDEFIEANKDLKDYMNKHFVVLKVNYSKENKNEAFLSQYPKVPGYPHFFVLDKNGKFLHSQDTGVLEENKGYSKTKIMEFLKKFAKA